jgi:hypothetical protein
MAKVVKPILSADEFFLLKRVIDTEIHNMENHETSIVVHYLKGDKNNIGLKNVIKEVAALKAAKAKLCKLFENQYETAI